MRYTLRIKLLGLVAINALALLVLVAASSLLVSRSERHISAIKEQHLPRMALRPRLEAQFEQLKRALQDASAAADEDLLKATRSRKDALIRELARAGDAIDAASAAMAQRAVEDYYDVAFRVSKQLIDGQSNPALEEAIKAMQQARERAATLIEKATAFDDEELAAAFDSASSTQRTATRLRLLISASCLILVLVLSLWISRGVLGSVGQLTDGLERFGSGDFDEPIPIDSRDELGDVAGRANAMAERLRRLAEDRDRIDWIKSARAGLAQELRGELHPEQVAERAVSFLARYLDAPVAALYYGCDESTLRRLGTFAVSLDDEGALLEVSRGDGLVGQAALTREVTVVTAPPGHLRIRSGVAEGSPRTIALVPLVHSGEVTGVLELAMLDRWDDRHQELVLAVRDTISVALEVARARADTRALLAETTAQATALERQRIALEDKNAELVQARRSLEHKADELLAANRYKSQFLANMSHELRTPLNAIIGFAELLHDGVVAPDSPQHREFLGDILTSGRHLLQLINDVLDLSKVEAGKLEFRPELVDLARVIGEVVGILRSTAAQNRITVSSQVSPSIGEVFVDPGRLKQVLYNYVSNALKFTPEGGSVDIRALPEGDDRFRLEVQDTGIGIAAADLDRLFLEFQQLDSEGSPQRGGTGLGLALTKRLVEAQGGNVGVRSRVGEGSAFFASLPRRASAGPAVTRVNVVEVAAGAPSVLVVEDTPADQAELVEALGRSGYSVEVASTGGQALELCQERAFDAITLDLLLPDMTGLEVLRRIRAGGRNRNVPVIVITVVAEPGAVAGFAVQDLLAKPVREDALLDALSRANLGARDQAAVLVIDDDPASLKLMATAIEQLGHRALCRSDGESALRLAREQRPGAIVLDLLMPGMDGFAFLDQLRSDPAGRTTPVIVWTSMDLSNDQRSRLRASAQAVVSKGHGGSAAVLAELETFLCRAAGEV